MRKLLFLVALAVIVWAAVVVPLPLAALEPVEAMPVTAIVDVEEETTDDLPQDLLFTAVQVRQPTAVGSVQVLLDDDRDLTFIQAVIPPGIDEEQFIEFQRQLFRESVRAAAAMGLRAAGREVQVEGDGARVVATIPGTPAAEVLQQEDVITEIDGEPVELASALAARLSERSAGEQVELTVRRGDELRTETIELTELSQIGQAGIGVAATTVNLQIDLPVQIQPAEDARVGGPSAGLMIALGVYGAVTDGDLTDGRTVAGTGTMDLTGRVGPVSGISEKVQGALLANADVFLVPEMLADQAREAAPEDLEVIPVATLQDAIDALTNAGGA